MRFAGAATTSAALAAAAASAAADVTIIGILDGTLTGGAPKIIGLYIAGTVPDNGNDPRWSS